MVLSKMKERLRRHLRERYAELSNDSLLGPNTRKVLPIGIATVRHCSLDRHDEAFLANATILLSSDVFTHDCVSTNGSEPPFDRAVLRL
jgi:hypothetical protein